MHIAPVDYYKLIVNFIILNKYNVHKLGFQLKQRVKICVHS
jgi:hypothetical protein